MKPIHRSDRALITAFALALSLLSAACAKEESESQPGSETAGQVTGDPRTIFKFEYQNVGKPMLAWETARHAKLEYKIEFCEADDSGCETVTIDCQPQGVCSPKTASGYLTNYRFNTDDTSGSTQKIRLEFCASSSLMGAGDTVKITGTSDGKTGAAVKGVENTSLAGSDYCEFSH